MELLKVDTIASARDKLLKVMEYKTLKTVRLNLLAAKGFVLAQDIVSHEDVPSFRRSTVDGYAVVASDTAGASDNLPVFLEIVEEVKMGASAKRVIHTGECAYVPTGGMIPDGADAMVMVEYCELFDETQVAVYCAVACGKNLVSVGEDMKQGQLVLKKGTTIRPQDIGALACIGITEVEVFQPWKITVISTGDELVSPEEMPPTGSIRDINSYALHAQANKHGFEVINMKIIKDKEKELREEIVNAMKLSDIVVISGGSSQGKKDATKKIIDEVASWGAFTHGLALKPGKPTILGYDSDTESILAGLPGHPVAAMLVFEMLIAWFWQHITYQPQAKSVFARINSNFAGSPGRMTCQLVRLIKRENEYDAEPIFGKSGLITTLTKADGYILIDHNKEGIKKDEIVEVFYI